MGETTWSLVSWTTFAVLAGVVEALPPIGWVTGVVVGWVLDTGAVVVDGVLAAYLEYIKKPRVPTISKKMAPKMAIALLFMCFYFKI